MTFIAEMAELLPLRSEYYYETMLDMWRYAAGIDLK